MTRLALPVLVLLAALMMPAGAAAAPSLTKVDDFAEPVHAAGPPGDPSRLFVVEKSGRVRLVVDGTTAATSFLDITAETADAYERGLLSIAFPSDYAGSGLFYVFVTANANAFGAGALGDLLVLEGRRSAQNPNRAEDSLRVVLRIPHPADNHNGGQLAFGPDGALYVSVGDGGSQGDPEGDAQDPQSLLGKILRLADPRTDAAPDIWARGLRNPWRFSFDRITGDVTIGDVGGGIHEEIDWVPAGSGAGRNYGWNRCEGVAGDCGWAGATAPVLALPRNKFTSVIGGFVVRDPGVPSLLGRYVFSDLAQPTVNSANLAAATYRAEASLAASDPRSFGEDGCGHVHVATANAVHRIQEGALGPCVVPPSPTAPGIVTPLPPAPGSPAGGSPADTAPCTLRVTRRTQRVRAIVLKLRSDEPCTATLRARGFKARTVALAAGAPRVVRLAPTKAGRRELRRALRTRRRVVRTVRISAVDAAGNVAVRTPRLKLR